MALNRSMSKDEIYGQPPAYSLEPLPPPSPSIYMISERRNYYPAIESPYTLSSNFLRYLIASGILHMLIGITSMVCDIILLSMNESSLFAGLWAGASFIILGIYLIVFTSFRKKSSMSSYRFKFILLSICIIIIVALILSSVNLASNSCSSMYFLSDQCQSAQKYKIILVTFFTFSFLQICITFIISFVHMR